jgi:hypothetical protein
MNDDLINKVESLKLMLMSHATGGRADATEYKDLRYELMSIPRIWPIAASLSSALP